MSINNKRSYTEYTVVQPTTDFAIGFDDFDEGSKDIILVTLNGVLVETLGYAAIRKNESTVTITPAITEGTVRLTRETDIDEPFHKFTAGALFSAKSMDENFQQVRHSQQEVRDGFVFLEYNTNGIVQASKEATAQAKAATVEATASAVRAETAADTAVQAVDSLQGVVDAATTATTEANTATATATTAASQATAATTTAQNAASAATVAKQEATAAAANASAATVDTLAATGRANEAADVVADLVVGKVRAQDVSTEDGSTQDVKNTEFRNELDAIPFEDGVLADTFVTMPVNDTGSIATNLRDFRSNNMTAKDFGVVGDGITDDTESLRAYHDYCNRRGMPASYRGLKAIVIDADAQIIVSTDWDLNGCPVNVINGNNAVPSSSTLKTAFIVSDPDTPIVEYTGSLAPENCVENSLTPTKGLVDTAGYAHLLDSSTLIPNRAGTGTSSYRQSFHILHDGHVALPLSQKINGSTVTIEHRENSKTGRLNIRNVSLNADANWNQLKLISVERNQVCIDGFIINHIAANPLGNISSLIDVYRAASFELKNVTCKGMEYSTAGTYVLGVSGCAELTLDNIQITTGWGWMGTNYVNGLYASKCVVDRIDCHASMHNVYTDSCTFTGLGVNVGWGGGVLQMTKTTLIDSSAVAFRPDYGSYFFGDVIINGVIVQSGEKSVVDMVKAGAVIGDTYFPKNITVSDVLYSEKSDSELKQGTVVYLRMADTSTDVKAPLSVTVSNVRASSKRNLVCMIDYGSATGWGGLDSTLSINDVSCATFKLYVIQSKDAGIIPVNLTFNMRDIKTSNGLWAYISHPINKFNIDNVDSIDVFDVPRDIVKSISQRVNIKNSVIINRKSTVARYDLTSTSWLNNIKYFNCEFEGAVDISGAQALQGCTFKDSKAVLPEGVTQENAYTGWHKTLMPPVIP